MIELLITSKDFETAENLIDDIFGKDASSNIHNGNDDLKCIELIKGADSFSIKDAVVGNQKSVLYLLSNIKSIVNENDELKKKVKLLEQRPSVNKAVNEKLKKLILKKRTKGKSYETIAYELNEKGLTNSYGRRLNGQQVRRLQDLHLRIKK